MDIIYRNVKRIFKLRAIVLVIVIVLLLFLQFSFEGNSDSGRKTQAQSQNNPLRSTLSNFQASLEMKENADFLLTPAILVQEAISEDVVITYPSE